MTDQEYLTRDLPLVFAALMQRVSSALVTFATLRIGMVLNGTELKDGYQALLIIATLLALILFPGPTRSELHRPRFWNTAISTFWSWGVLFTVLLVLGYATKTSEDYSRKLLFSWAIVAPVAILFTRVVFDRVIAQIARSRSTTRRVVIAGVNENARLLASKIERNPDLGLVLDGHFDDRSRERLGEMPEERLLGRLVELPGYVRSHRTDLIYIALPMRNIQRVTELLDELHDTTASIYYVPDVFVFDLIQCRTDEIDGMPVVALCETPFHGSRGMVKRASDFLFALVILILISPVLLLIALGVKLTTPGSVFFKQRRYGLDGREITVYKFRTMNVSEDSDSVRQATRGDRRVTRFGAFLRRLSLDELPQFINVLQGRMSVVGPRPHAIAHNEEYRRLIKGYMVRHKVTPGITGLAQVRGHRGETATIEEMRERVESDLEYLRNWSLELDIRIIFRTIGVVFKDKKAY